MMPAAGYVIYQSRHKPQTSTKKQMNTNNGTEAKYTRQISSFLLAGNWATEAETFSLQTLRHRQPVRTPRPINSGTPNNNK